MPTIFDYALPPPPTSIVVAGLAVTWPRQHQLPRSQPYETRPRACLRRPSGVWKASQALRSKGFRLALGFASRRSLTVRSLAHYRVHEVGPPFFLKTTFLERFSILSIIGKAEETAALVPTDESFEGSRYRCGTMRCVKTTWSNVQKRHLREEGSRLLFVCDNIARLSVSERDIVFPRTMSRVFRRRPFVR